jgi:hypothetical protein
MTTSTLDNMDNPSISDELIPFQFREDKTEDGTHRWLNSRFEWEYEKAFPRFIMYRRYINMYKNLDEYEGDGMMRTASRDRLMAGSGAKKPRIKDNFIFSYTEQRVSQVAKKKIALTFIPRVQNSQKDINASKATKLLVKARYEDMNMDGEMIKMDRTTYMLGHSFFENCWDENIGPVAPAYERAIQKKLDVKDMQFKIGDTKGRLWQPYHVFPEAGKLRLHGGVEACDYIETIEWMTKQYVEHKWKKAKGKIKGNAHTKWDFGKDKLSTPNNEIMVRTFWHRPTEFFPEGCKIVYCDDLILEWVDFPYSHKELPFVDEKDIEVENEFWGRPFITNIEQLYKVNNSVISGMARNHGVASAPKWMYPEGSVDLKSLNNDFSGVAYRGPEAPKLVQHNYVNSGELEFQKYLQSRAGELSSVFEISRGIVPQGITAAQAIRYLDEQEQQRATPSIAKRNRRIIDITKQQVKLMAQYYKDSDERTARLVGENNEFIIRSFKSMAFLASVVDVRMENVSALSDTYTGAVADIIDLNAANQADPLFGKKETIKYLRLGLSEAFEDESTYGVDTARTILEMILEGEEVPPPVKSDDLFSMYDVIGRFMESTVYKLKTEPEIKQSLEAYVMGLEMLMWQKSVENLKFATLLQMNEKFPMFFAPPTPPAPIAPPAEGGGAAPAADTAKMDITNESIQRQQKEEDEDLQGVLV